MKPLFLIGYMGCGKSTLGRKIARRLHWDFVDTDHEVEQQEGASTADIFHYEGEEHFREMERGVLDRLVAEGGCRVISTGGGLPVWRDNMERMNAEGITLYLKRSPEQIARRMSPYGRQKRPRLRGLSDEELIVFMREDMARREEFYRRAQITVTCDTCTDFDLINRIVGLLDRFTTEN